jgi:molybdenum cofactor cytidylyltransferase
MGRPKQLLKLGGEYLLERAVRTARQAGFSPIVVVLGAAEKEIRTACNLSKTSIVSHSKWGEGMGTSIATGMRAITEVDVAGVIVMTCDMPAVTTDHLRRLAASGDITGSTYGDRNGVPAYFPRSVFAELLELSGDKGARDLLCSKNAVELRQGNLDIDTPEDWSAARERFG